MSSDVIDILRWQDKELKNEAQRLTDRQRDVLQLLAEGRTMKEIGTILQMSSRTVAYHKYRMMEVLGVKSNAELVKYAVRNKIVAA
jgi:DNA-binding CsgD family transcriptional regulator